MKTGKKSKKRKVVYSHIYYPYPCTEAMLLKIYSRVAQGLIEHGWMSSGTKWKWNRTVYTRGERVFYL